MNLKIPNCNKVPFQVYSPISECKAAGTLRPSGFGQIAGLDRLLDCVPIRGYNLFQYAPQHSLPIFLR